LSSILVHRHKIVFHGAMLSQLHIKNQTYSEDPQLCLNIQNQCARLLTLLLTCGFLITDPLIVLEFNIFQPFSSEISAIHYLLIVS
jgi:hypothetical protein